MDVVVVVVVVWMFKIRVSGSEMLRIWTVDVIPKVDDINKRLSQCPGCLIRYMHRTIGG